MTKPLSTLVIGAGDRGFNAWAKFAQEPDSGIEITGVAEPDKNKRDEFAKRYNINDERTYRNGDIALYTRDPYDAVIIATPDKTHHDLAVQALKKGYNVLLEKPMSTTEMNCRNIIDMQRESGHVLSVAHVLRYAPFFDMIHALSQPQKGMGRLKEIDLTEEVGYWHFAHSYVRGNWAREEESSPVILAKSCHDLDIIAWLANSKARTVTSIGSLRQFTPDNYISISAERCTDDCPVKDCLFDARNFYIGEHVINDKGEVSWPYSVMSRETDQGKRLEALKESPYGRCVYKCGNDVMDYQDVSMDFENGVRGNFRLRTGGDNSTRHIKLYFEGGEIFGDLRKGRIHRIFYNGKRAKGVREDFDKGALGGHGGGDARLLKDFVHMIREGNSEGNRTSAQLSLQSHLMAFAAEESRKTGRTVEL